MVLPYVHRFQACHFCFLEKSSLTQNLMNSIARVGCFASQSLQLAGCGFQQIRTKYADWKMIRDVKRRKCVSEHAKDRLRVNALRKNDILPVELREVADAEIAAFPRDSCLVRVRERCAFTSRSRGVVHKYRLSRIVWRHLADYNKLAGVQRAMW